MSGRLATASKQCFEYQCLFSGVCVNSCEYQKELQLLKQDLQELQDFQDNTKTLELKLKKAYENVLKNSKVSNNRK